MKGNLLIGLLFLLVGAIQAQAQSSAPVADNAVDPAVIDQDSVYSCSTGQKAQFKGGDIAFQKYVMNNFTYPARCQENGIGGSVLLRFVVDVDGRIVNIQVLEVSTKCPEFGQEAVRILKNSPRWIPGMHNGRYVKSYRELPLKMAVQ
jgi:protein TonB